MARLIRMREIIKETLWLAPAVGVVLALVLAVVMIALDETFTVGTSAVIGFDGGPDSARSILSTIAASMLTFLALVFTLTVVTLQLASDFSPRLLRSFLAGRASKVALALFVATFTYAVLVLREVSPSSVPELSVTAAIVLVILSVLVFVYYVSDIAQSLRVASIVEHAGDTTRAELERDAAAGEPGAEEDDRDRGWAAVQGAEPRQTLAWPGAPGVITTLDLAGFRDLAVASDGILELRAQVGDFLPTGAPVLAAYGAGEELEQGRLEGLLAVAKERTISQDPAFGIRQLADIGARALSPGVNDPTTAVQALDQVHDILLRLGSMQLYSGVLRGDDGEVRVLVPVHSWNDYVHLAIDEMRIYGDGSMQVSRRLRSLLGDLRDRLPDCRRAAVERQLKLLDSSVEAGFRDEADRRRARLTTTAVGGSEGGG